jgi:hypothetical protein
MDHMTQVDGRATGDSHYPGVRSSRNRGGKLLVSDDVGSCTELTREIRRQLVTQLLKLFWIGGDDLLDGCVEAECVLQRVKALENGEILVAASTSKSLHEGVSPTMIAWDYLGHSFGAFGRSGEEAGVSHDTARTLLPRDDRASLWSRVPDGLTRRVGVPIAHLSFRRTTPADSPGLPAAREETEASMSTVGLTPVAAFVLRSLRDHPDLRLPEAIVAEAEASGVDSKGSLDVQAVRDGLAELASRGLAEEGPGGGWRLAEATR